MEEKSHKKKAKHGDGLHGKEKVNTKGSFFTFLHLLIIFLAFFIGGVLLGVITTVYTPDLNIIKNEENIFKFLLKDKKVVIGGNININMHIKNRTVLPYTFNSKNVQYFYYPIGADYSCLLYNGGVEEKSANQTPLSQKSQINVPSNHNQSTFPTQLVINIPYSLINPSMKIYSASLHLGYEITDTHKHEVQALYNDCKKYDKLYNSRMKRELIFECKCFIDKNVEYFFNTYPVYKPIILQNLQNNPDIII
ncbi:conserved protein, unknown function [Hepatocystis sp. ex Piliocolobus tephrosceles]|nr:conserved protein, unknown function [Hepatocystis sp. ex Piliocolobus tephrosceles]